MLALHSVSENISTTIDCCSPLMRTLSPSVSSTAFKSLISSSISSSPSLRSKKNSSLLKEYPLTSKMRIMLYKMHRHYPFRVPCITKLSQTHSSNSNKISPSYSEMSSCHITIQFWTLLLQPIKNPSSHSKEYPSKSKKASHMLLLEEQVRYFNHCYILFTSSFDEREWQK